MSSDHPLIALIESEYLKTDTPEICVGDEVCANVKIKEGTKERIQKFVGLVLAKGGCGLNKHLTIRKISSGIGVERTFIINSPLVTFDVVGSNPKKRVKKAKLYYRRKLTGKKARIQYETNNK